MLASFTSAVGALILVYVFYHTVRILYYSYNVRRLGKATVPASRVGSPSTHRVLLLGDCTGYGTGASSPSHSLAGLILADFADIELVNASESGLCTKTLLAKLKAEENESFDMIICINGGTDVLKYTSLGSIRGTAKQIAAEAQRICSGPVVFVSMNNVGVAPMFAPLSLLYDRRSLAVSEAIDGVCTAHGMVHIPLYRERSKDPFADDKSCFFSEDKLHPSDAGYALWYEEIRPHISAILR